MLDTPDDNGYGDDSHYCGHSAHLEYDMPLPVPEFPQIPPDNITTGQLYALMLSMHSQLSVQVRAINDLKMRDEVTRQQMAEMVDTWKTAKGVLRFVKLLGALGAAWLSVAGALSLINK